MAAAASAAAAAAARISAVLSDAQYFESGMVRVEDIRRLLDSRSLKDKLDAMKRIVALISLGRDASIFFPDVVKNVVAPSLDVKKLVYLYLVHYAEDKQDLALLSINSFQKDISDPNQLIRALALRVLSSIRVKVILQVVIVAINKCAKDPSPYVRKAAAHAISKVFSLDSSSGELLLEPLALLLNDRSLDVLGSAVAVFEEVVPDQYHMIHAHFRHLCASLSDMDPFGQAAAMRVLLRYSRSQFANPWSAQCDKLDTDLSLLLSSVHPLLLSQAPSVVFCAIAIYFHVGSLEQLKSFAILPLMRFVSSTNPSTQYVAMSVACEIISRAPGAFLMFLSEFFVSVADGMPIREKKLAVISRMCERAGDPNGLSADPEARRVLFNEFNFYLSGPDRALAAAATRCMGQLASSHPPSTAAVVDLLGSVVACSTNSVVVSESVTVLRRLLQLHPNAQSRALPRLMSLLLIPGETGATIQAPEARSAIIWLIAEFYDKAPHVAPEALRLLTRNFREEHPQVKLQILNLAAVVYSWRKSDRHLPKESNSVSLAVRQKLLDYLTLCALCDADYDVRDKARLFRRVFLENINENIMRAAVEGFVNRERGQKASGHESDYARVSCASEVKTSDLPIASMSQVVGRRLPGCRPVPAWADTNSNAKAREDSTGVARTGGGVMQVTGISSSNFSDVNSSRSYSNNSTYFDATTSAPNFNSGTSQAFTQRNTPSSNTRSYRHIDPQRFYSSDSESSKSAEHDEDNDAVSSETDDSDAVDDAASDLSEHALLSSGTTEAAVASHGRHSDLDLLFAALSSNEDPELDTQKVQSASLSLFDRKSSLTSPDRSVLLDDRLNPSQLPLNWHRVMDSWQANGIQLDVCFVNRSVEMSPIASPLMFRVSNVRKDDVSGVAISSSSEILNNGEELRHGSILAGHAVEVQSFAAFGGRTVTIPIRLAVEGSDVGEGEIRPNAGQVLKPNPSLTGSEFAAIEKSLSGMFGCNTRLQMSRDSLVSASANTLHSFVNRARRQVLENAFLAEICAANSALNGCLLFAGFLPPAKNGSSSDKSDVLVRLQLELQPLTEDGTDGADGSLWIGCDNVVYANNLAQHLRRAVC